MHNNFYRFQRNLLKHTCNLFCLCCCCNSACCCFRFSLLLRAASDRAFDTGGVTVGSTSSGTAISLAAAAHSALTEATTAAAAAAAETATDAFDTDVAESLCEIVRFLQEPGPSLDVTCWGFRSTELSELPPDFVPRRFGVSIIQSSSSSSPRCDRFFDFTGVLWW